MAAVQPLNAELEHVPAPPAEARTTTLRPLIGHSGAKLTLRQRGAASFVRKAAGHSSQNARLLLQAEKQRHLRALGIPFPRVLREGIDDDLAFFEMEYVPGRTIAATIVDAAPFDTFALARAIERAFSLFAIAQSGTVSPDLFTAKIEEIASHCEKRTLGIADAGDLRMSVARLLLCDWSGIPASPCHGDMTLENILLTSAGKMIFIDCDEPWASSYWLDIAKLYQDLSGHWCLRRLYLDETPSVALLNATQGLERVGAAMKGLTTGAGEPLTARLPQMAALHLLRTLPYAVDDRLVAFVLRRIRTLIS